MTGFRRREVCEVCRGLRVARLLSLPFGDPRVGGFLERYYGGRIPPDALGGGRYEILRCAGCSFAWQAEVLDEAGMGRLYGEWISSADSLRKKEQTSATLFLKYAVEARLVERLVGKPPHETRVLDFGMGWGYWCRVAAAFNYDVVGLELSPERREHARAMGVRTVGALDELGGEPFDFVNAEQVLEHVPDPGGLVGAMAERLRPGGVLRVAVPNAAGALRRLGSRRWSASKDALHPLEHVNAFTRRSLGELGKRAGLAPVTYPWWDPFALWLRLRYASGLVAWLRR